MRARNNHTGGQNRGSTLRLRSLWSRFARNEGGATSIEYGLICSLLFLAIVSAIGEVGSKTQGMHNKIQSSL